MARSGSFGRKALMLLALSVGVNAYPCNVLAQGGFAPDDFGPPDDEQQQQCLIDAQNRFEERHQSADNSLTLCLAATGLANAVVVAGCVVATAGAGAVVCLTGVAASEAAAATLCLDAFVNAMEEAERDLEFETNTCLM